MKRYRVRERSPLWYAMPWLTFALLVIVTGLGNHFIDGI